MKIKDMNNGHYIVTIKGLEETQIVRASSDGQIVSRIGCEKNIKKDVKKIIHGPFNPEEVVTDYIGNGS